MATPKKTTKARHRSPVETDAPVSRPMVVYNETRGPAGFPVSSVSNGDVLAGASMVGDPAAMGIVVEAQWEEIVQAEIDVVTAARELKAEETEELYTAFQKATAVLVFPADFLADAEALAAAHRKFSDDVTVTGVNTNKLLTKLTQPAKALSPMTGITVSVGSDGGTVTYQATLKISENGTYRSNYAVTLSRETDAPADLVAAFKAWEDAKAEVAELDRKLVDLARKKQNAPKLGRQASAATTIAIMNESDRGRRMLEVAQKAVASQARRAGLKFAPGDEGMLAIVGTQAPAAPAPAVQE